MKHPPTNGAGPSVGALDPDNEQDSDMRNDTPSPSPAPAPGRLRHLRLIHRALRHRLATPTDYRERRVGSAFIAEVEKRILAAGGDL